MTPFDPTRLPERALSSTVLGPDGQPAVKVESLPVERGAADHADLRICRTALAARRLLAATGRLVFVPHAHETPT
jgi:hypothetical protein